MGIGGNKQEFYSSPSCGHPSSKGGELIAGCAKKINTK
jgi:hypothetical protein